MAFRVSFGFKIFGICIFLVSLMCTVSGISIHLVNQVEMRLTHLAHHYAPIADDLDSIERLALQQELSFERMRLLLRLPSEPEKGKKHEQEQFYELGRALDRQVNQLLGRLKDTLKLDLLPEAVKEMHRLQVSLKTIEKEHQDFETNASHYLAEYHELNDKAKMRIENILEAEVEEYARVIHELRDEMSQFNRDAALAAQKDEAQLRQLDILLTLIAAFMGLLFAAMLTNSLVKPIQALLSAAKRVGKGHLDVSISAASQDELGELTQGFQEMVTQLQRKEHIQETFGRFVDPRIVGQLIEQPDGVDLAGQRRNMTVMFSDLAGFTSISERLSPQDLVSLLNAYLTKMAEPIGQNHGVIDKFIGDAILAYWGEPFVKQDQQGVLATNAALATLDLIQPFQETIPQILGLRDTPPTIDLRIGIATGPVIVGAIGSETSKNYTVMGDTVNIGARLEAACKIYGVRNLIDEPTAQSLGEETLYREVDLLQLKGKSQPIRVFELVGQKERASEGQIRSVEMYAHGLAAYRDQQWEKAAQAFQEALKLHDEDGAAKIMLERIDSLKQGDQLGPDWNGVWHQQSK